MEDGPRREQVVEEVESGEDEEREVNFEVVDDAVARNGVDGYLRACDNCLNLIGLGAEDAAPQARTVIDLGTPTYPIRVGDLPLHIFGYQEILLTCPPLQEASRARTVIDLGTPTHPIRVGDLPLHIFGYQEILLTCPPLQED